MKFKIDLILACFLIDMLITRRGERENVRQANEFASADAIETIHAGRRQITDFSREIAFELGFVLLLSTVASACLPSPEAITVCFDS